MFIREHCTSQSLLHRGMQFLSQARLWKCDSMNSWNILGPPSQHYIIVLFYLLYFKRYDFFIKKYYFANFLRVSAKV